MQIFELRVDEAVRVGHRVITVLDIEDDEVQFEIDSLPNEFDDDFGGESVWERQVARM